MGTALVVDDNSDIRAMLARALEIKGFRVKQAENGKVAQEHMIESTDTCVVLLDLMMPVMDGHQFLSWKNDIQEYADIPVVVISALPAATGMKGVHAILRKPVDLRELIIQVKGYCCDRN